MTDLQDRLGRLAPTVDPEAGLADLHRRVRHDRRRRQAIAGVVASVALVGAVVAAVVLLDAGEESGTRIATEPEPGRPDIVEGWVDLPDGPLPPAFEPATDQAVWTGEEFLWWGSAGDGRARTTGAAFDPETETWRSMAESPLRGRSTPVVVWTGEEMIVWGGGDTASGYPASGVPYDVEAAAYDPDSDSWRVIAEAPIEPRGSAAAVWDGQQMIVAGGERFDGPPECPDRDTCLAQGQVGLPTPRSTLDGAAYDPEDDEWALIADPPAHVGRTVTWDGTEMLTFSGLNLSGGFAVGATGLAYDPGSDTWRELGSRTDDGSGLVDPRFAAAGGLVLAIEAAGNEAEGAWFVYERDLDEWARVDELPRAPEGVCSPTATLAGDAVAVLGCGQAVYAPETSSWYLLDELPGPFDDLVTVQRVGANDQMLMVLNPSPFDPTRPGPESRSVPVRFVAYRGDFATYAVPDVEGLTLGEARRIMAAEGFVLNAHETDPQGDDAVVRAQEPPGGTRALGIAPEVGVRTDPAP